MRCRFCGAEIKEGNNVCEYCGSTVERNTAAAQNNTAAAQNNRKPAKSIVGIICKGIIILACVGGAVLVISLIVVLNSDVFKDNYASTYTAYATYEMPQNEKNLIGQIISCDKKGVAVIEYQGHTYEDVAILDKSLIEWINATDRKIDTVGICFATDGEGDISELGLLSPDFFVMEKEEERYLAVRESQVITFTSVVPLEVEHYYGGYFSYPDLRLYSVEEKYPMSMTYMDPKCEDKEREAVKEYYTGEEITVYKIYVAGKWFYCSQETYDSVEIGDLLDEYKMYPFQEPAFIVGKAALSHADAEELSDLSGLSDIQ